MTEDKTVGWHHRLDGHGFGWTPGVDDGQEAWRAAVHRVTKSWAQLILEQQLIFQSLLVLFHYSSII